MVNPAGGLIEKVVHLSIKTSNNEVQYEAEIYALQEMKRMWATKVLFTDSKLRASQFVGTYEAKTDRMSAYLDVL